MLTGLEAKLQQPRGLPTRQLVLIGAIWAGCIAALEAALGRLARPSPAAADPGAVPPSAAAGATAAATSSSSAPAAVPAQQPRQVGAGGAGEMRQGSQPGMQQPASVPPPAGSTSGASLRRPRSSSFWEDGRAFPYLVAVMAAVPVVVGWVRRRPLRQLQVSLGCAQELPAARAAVQFAYTGRVEVGSIREALQVRQQAAYLQMAGCAEVCVWRLYAALWPDTAEDAAFAGILREARQLLVAYFRGAVAALC
ncbi:hypothetical protein HYH02_008635 [Chlamydomonas schloesseri]|uniref:Uncharacterized protein n=1 Tax=Chlamydomonas schloesseri TaxID=2026947 RepID=A0A835WD27_9CHLO|nr:hypothetical protein HYH02_008635 [Chlamydomonas schloesseri]|eukprot:KAG2445167.1 hypothetical protein HYH02_008635 [Chlamydomonas schloesseri]